MKIQFPIRLISKTSYHALLSFCLIYILHFTILRDVTTGIFLARKATITTKILLIINVIFA